MRRIRGSPRLVVAESSSSARSSLDFRSPLPLSEPRPSRVPSTRPFRLTAAAADAVISSALLQGQQRPPGHRKRNRKRGGGHFGVRRNTTAEVVAEAAVAADNKPTCCADQRPQHSDSSGSGLVAEEGIGVEASNCIILPSHAQPPGEANDSRLMSSLVASKLFRHALNDAVNSQLPGVGMRRTTRHHQQYTPPATTADVVEPPTVTKEGQCRTNCRCSNTLSTLPGSSTLSNGLPYSTTAAAHTTRTYSTHQQQQQPQPFSAAAADAKIVVSQSSTVATSHSSEHRDRFSSGAASRRLLHHATNTAANVPIEGPRAVVPPEAEDLAALKGYDGKFTWSAAGASTPNVKLASELAASFNWSAFLYATTPHFLRRQSSEAADCDEDKILSEFALPYRLARQIKFRQLALQHQRRSNAMDMKLLGDVIHGSDSSAEFSCARRRRSSQNKAARCCGNDEFHNSYFDDDDDDAGSTSAASWTANEEDFVDPPPDFAAVASANPLLAALGTGLEVPKERPTLIDAESLSTNELLAKTFNHRNSCLEHLPLASQCKLLGLLDGLGLVSSVVQKLPRDDIIGTILTSQLSTEPEKSAVAAQEDACQSEAQNVLFEQQRLPPAADHGTAPLVTPPATAAGPSALGASQSTQFAFRLSNLWESWAATSRTGVEAPYVDAVTGEVSSLVWHPLLSGFSLVGNENGRFRGVRLDYLEQRPPHTRKPFSVTLRRLMQQRELSLTAAQLELLTQSTNEDLNKLQSWMSVLWVPTQLMTPTQPLPRPNAYSPATTTVEQLVELSIANVTSAAKAAQKDTSFPQFPSYVVFYAFYSTTDCELAKLNNSAHVYCPSGKQTAVTAPPLQPLLGQPTSRVSGLFNSTPQLARFGVFPQRGLQQGWHVEIPHQSVSAEAATDAMISQSTSYFDRWFMAEGFSHADYIYGKRRSRPP